MLIKKSVVKQTEIMNSEKGFDKTAAEVRQLKALLRRREEENVGLAKKIEQLESENDEIHQENRGLKETINRAKDISPWMRPNPDNVRRMARRAYLDIVKAPGGWVVKMGEIIGKKFKRLRDIWLILTSEESWSLNDDFLSTLASAPASAPTSAAAPATAPAAAPAPAAPAPTSARASAPPPRTRKELAEIEVLRAEWRMFPSMRGAIEEAMMRLFGITLEPRDV